jgi:hypothetical protein
MGFRQWNIISAERVIEAMTSGLEEDARIVTVMLATRSFFFVITSLLKLAMTSRVQASP